MKSIVTISLIALALAVSAENVKPITLPTVEKTGGMPLMQALAERRSSRSFATAEVPDVLLSRMLWAACGINRPDGRRTTPTAKNTQDMDIYVMRASGAYRYDARTHALVPVNSGDHRQTAGKQKYAQEAPLTLIYVQDTERSLKDDSPQYGTVRYGGVHAGAIMQNVYLFCAQERLACVARMFIDYETLGRVLKLRPGQRIILAQSIGYEKPVK